MLSQLKEIYFWQVTIKLLTLKGRVDFYLSLGKLWSMDHVEERELHQLTQMC